MYRDIPLNDDLLKKIQQKELKAFCDTNNLSIETALHEMCYSGQLDKVRRLLDLGVDINRIVEGIKPLYSACMEGRIDVVKVLLEYKADLYGALTYASAYGHLAIVQLLLEKGADPRQSETTEGQTPLDYANQYQHLAIVNLLTDWIAKHPLPATPQ